MDLHDFQLMMFPAGESRLSMLETLVSYNWFCIFHFYQLAKPRYDFFFHDKKSQSKTDWHFFPRIGTAQLSDH